jgi:hypothetical protein
VGFIGKPFRPDFLASKVREMLDTDESGHELPVRRPRSA